MLAEQLAIDPGTITSESSLRGDLKADSLDVVQLIMCVEEAYNIEVEDEAVGRIATVGDIVEYITDKAAG
ncbi:MAG: acyl carrier protein [Clostridia bacterium]|nr:acyl carrier protein [Clostridia bacterium]